MNYLKDSLQPVPQSEPLPGQVPNSAGGHAWSLDRWGRLRRFLILGSEGGTYYIGERKLTKENLSALDACVAENAERAVNEIVTISAAGLAPKNDQAIFALARVAATGPEQARSLALEHLSAVCRIGTHLFMFCDFVNGQRGWGRGLRRGVARWYEEKSPDQLAYQLVKYRQRGGWTHRDVLRLAHPKAPTAAHKRLYDFACGRAAAADSENDSLLIDHYAAMLAKEWQKPADAVDYIKIMPREALPTEWLNDPKVWEALLEEMPMTAMIRNLGNMSKVGLLTPGSSAERVVTERLADLERLRRSRVHPLQVLLAQATYAAGRGFRGSGTWMPCSNVVDALDEAFYMAFENVEPTGKTTLLALDVSGSMTQTLAGTMLSCRQGAAAMALVTARVEDAFYAGAFQTEFEPVTLSRRSRLDDVLRIQWKGGGTDCAQPMLAALQNKLFDIDTFIVYTDSETWHGRVHPAEALRMYRSRSGREDAKLVVVGMTSNRFTIADPDDGGMLDVVGFDASAPQVISEFARGLL